MLQCNENRHEQVVNPQPLTNAEFDKLAEVLKRFGNKRAMNLETLDGFFAALICGPDNVLPSEYLPEIWGDDMANEPVFETKPILHEFISLITRHWNATCHTLQSGDVFLPLLLDDENGLARANDWASGFMRGMEMRRDGWAVLMDDEAHAGSLIPILALAHEHRRFGVAQIIIGAAAHFAQFGGFVNAGKALCDNEPGLGTLSFQQRVGRNRSCMKKKSHVFGSAARGEKVLERLHHSPRQVRWRA